MKGKSLNLKRAISLQLNEWKHPIITDYQLGIFIFNLYNKPEYKGNPICTQTSSPEHKEYSYVINQCLEDGILLGNKNFPQKSVFNILGAHQHSSEEIICAVDPFAYISHLSAMDFHGLTDRNPKTLHMTRPKPKEWKDFALSKMEKDLGDLYIPYMQSKFPKLSRFNVDKINRRPIHFFHSVHLGAYKNVQDRFLRVSTIGRTFLDMLRKPDLCGGMEHVLDVFEEYGEKYLPLILEEIDRHGKPIEKVRAGYIFEELLNIKNPKIKNWEKFIQRGGSRKLDPSTEYSPTYSEKWCLSINTIKERE